MIHQKMRILRNISVFKLLCKASSRKGLFGYGIKAVPSSLLITKRKLYSFKKEEKFFF